VYQAYHRMLRVERTADGAEYVILYVWGDDPARSVMRCRWGQIYPWHSEDSLAQGLFNGNFWAHVEIDLETGSFVELENPLSTPESLYAMCDPEWMLEHLRDDLALQLAVYAGDPDYEQPGRIDELDRPKIAVHQREYEQAGGSYHEYLSRYMVGGDGHYNPRGNHMFAYALKDRLLELLDPKPLPDQDRGPETVDFGEYLRGTGGPRHGGVIGDGASASK
jgi:hypothetical protein